MAPWWIRPTSDEAEQEQQKTEQEKQEQGSVEAREESAPAAAPPAEPTPQVQVEPSRESSPEPQREAAAAARTKFEEVSPPSAVTAATNESTDEATGQGKESAPAASGDRPPSSRSRGRRGGRGRRRSSRSSEQGESHDVSSRQEPAAVESQEEEAESQPSLEAILREIFLDSPQRSASDETESKIALFCDFENIALGVRQSHNKKFEIALVLERLLEKGKVIVKKAYSDWSRYSDYKKTFHESGIELIEIPQKYYSGKNSADIKMVVDAMDLCYSNEHIDTYVILSGDSDFSPLVSKLKENNKYVIGVGVKDASSNLLIDNCDEFIYYEDLWRDAQTAPLMKGLEAKDAEAFGLMTDAMQALIRENKEVLWGSMVKQTMKRKKPSFNEGYYGYRTFSELLEDAEDKGIVNLRRDKRSGSYIVTGFGGEG